LDEVSLYHVVTGTVDGEGEAVKQVLDVAKDVVVVGSSSIAV
jgi:hypothetical protein